MFDNTIRDAQSTAVTGLNPEQFDFDAYQDYTAGKDAKIKAFVEADSGVLVYRRFRVAEVFGAECKDKELSLRLQLGALKASMDYEADIPNFLEPWYGLGIGAAAFGPEYVWNPGQAPAITAPFEDLEGACSFDLKEIKDTNIGREQLSYIEYFMDKTRGKLPMSFSDVQSPLNIISEVVPATSLFLDMLEEPEDYLELADRVADNMGRFLKLQQALIGDALALPGHGFASSRNFRCLGASDDTSIMISNPMFDALEAGPLSKLCAPYGGPAYHSCGNWSKKIPSVLSVPGIVCADGAFSSQTDPAPNPCEDFSEQFAGTGVVLNARVVGGLETVEESVRKLWRPGMKLIVNTYCKTPEEQREAYQLIHEICR